jgi:peptide deformylase
VTTTTTRRGAAVVARGKKKGFLFGEVENLSREGEGTKGDDEDAKSVRWSEPLAIAKYPAKCLRAKNAPVETFDKNLERLSKAMFKIMYETVGCGLAAPQVGVNYRMMVYNEAGEPGQGREVVLCNPQIVKFSKEKDLFEEGCLSFPKMYADVEVRIERRRRARLSRHARDERAYDDQNINIR